MSRKQEKWGDKINESFRSNRYRAVEKMEHETEMRVKAFFTENFIYLLPFGLAVVGWWIFTMWKNSQLPYGQEYSALQAIGLIPILIGLGLTIFAFLYVKPKIAAEIEKQTEELTKDVYKSGARIVGTKIFNSRIFEFLKEELSYSRTPEKDSLKFILKADPLSEDHDKVYEEKPEDIIIPRISLSMGLMILGTPGRGKSVAIDNLLKQVPIDDSTKQIVADVKGDFVEKFYDPKKDIIVCPSDLRSVRFDLYELVENQVDAGLMSEILVPDDKTSADPHWVNAARAVMEGLLLYASKRRMSNNEIYETLGDVNKLAIILDDEQVYPIVANFIRIEEDGVSKETSSIVSTAVRKAKALQYLAQLDTVNNDKISFKDWLFDGKGGKMFLLSNTAMQKVYAPLYGVITSYFVTQLLSAEDPGDRDTYFVLDELPQLGKSLRDNLEKALAVGRSRGLKIIMAAQDFVQLKKEFGEKEAESLLGTTNSLVTFQSNQGAQHLEKYYGKQTVIQNNEGFSMGMAQMADRTSINRRIATMVAIKESDINRLSKFEIYAKIEGCKDILKARISKEFVPKNGQKAYVENPSMRIRKIDEIDNFVTKAIKNKFVDFQNVEAVDKNKQVTINY